MEDSNFITIQGWMVNRLNLEGTDLLIFAIIYGFSQDGKSEFTGSNQYLQKTIRKSRNTVRDSLKRLEENQLIIRKVSEPYPGVEINRFTANLHKIKGLSKSNPPRANFDPPPRSESDENPGQKLTPIIKDYNNEEGPTPSPPKSETGLKEKKDGDPAPSNFDFSTGTADCEKDPAHFQEYWRHLIKSRPIQCSTILNKRGFALENWPKIEEAFIKGAFEFCPQITSEKHALAYMRIGLEKLKDNKPKAQSSRPEANQTSEGLW